MQIIIKKCLTEPAQLAYSSRDMKPGKEDNNGAEEFFRTANAENITQNLGGISLESLHKDGVRERLRKAGKAIRTALRFPPHAENLTAEQRESHEQFMKSQGQLDDGTIYYSRDNKDRS